MYSHNFPLFEMMLEKYRKEQKTSSHEAHKPQQIEEYHFLCGIKSILTQKKKRGKKEKKTFPLLLSLLLL